MLLRDRSRGRQAGRRGQGRGRGLRPNAERLEDLVLLAPTVAEFPLRGAGGVTVGITSGLGSDTNLYFTALSAFGSPAGTFNNIGVYDTSTGLTGKVSQYAVPTPNAGASDLAAGNDGKVYFLEVTANQIGVFDPKLGAVTAEYPLPSAANAGLTSITLGPDGQLWFTEKAVNRIGAFNPVSHAFTEITAPTPNSQPFGITTDTLDKTLWFTEFGSNKVGVIDPKTHVVSDTLISSGTNLGAGPIVFDPVDNRVYFIETQTKKVNSIDPKALTFSGEVSGVQDTSNLDHMTVDGSGFVYFTENGSDALGRLAPGTNTIVQIGVPSPFKTGPEGITLGQDGGIWYATSNSNTIDRVSGTTSKAVALPYISIANSATTLVTDNAGTVWFAQSGDAQVGKFSPTTHYTTETAIPSGYQPQQLALDTLDGTVWFTDTYSFSTNDSNIGIIDPATGAVVEHNVPDVSAAVRGITFNAKGDGNFWFAESGSNSIGEINTGDKAISGGKKVPAGETGPNGIVADASGNLWVTMTGSGTVDHYNLSTQSWLSKPVALAGGSNSNPSGIIIGPDKNIWVSENGGGGFPSAPSRVAVIDPITAKVVAEFTVPATGAITNGPDGNVWITEAGSVAAITPGTYAVTTYAVPNAVPQAVAAGADGNLYFAGRANFFPTFSPNIIGAVTLATPAQPAKLAVTAQPVNVTAGKGFSLVVAVENAAGAVDTFASPVNGSVTLSLAAGPAGATLGTVNGGSLTAPVNNGVAVFSGLFVDTAGTGYVLSASYPGLASAMTAPITAAMAATRLSVTAQPPAGIAAGVPFPVTVATLDPAGNLDTSYTGPVTVSFLNNPGSATLGGTTILGAVGGLVTFPDLTINKPGNGYTLGFSTPAGNLSPATTGGFNVSAGPATHFTLTAAPPSSVNAGDTFGFVVTALDAQGSVATTFNGQVTASVATGPSGSVLGGTVTIAASSGVATFSGLTLTAAGSYTLRVSASGLTPTTTPAIIVSPGAAAVLLETSVPSGTVTAGTALAVKVQAVDAFGNTASAYNGAVGFTSTDPSATLPTAYTFTAADKGAHTFNAVLKTAGSQTLTVADPLSLTLSASEPFTVNPAATTQLILAAPASATAGAAFSVTVSVRDAFNNPTPAYTGTVHFSSTDASAALPAEYTFTAADKGAHTFNAAATLKAAGNQLLTAADAGNPALKITAPVAVSPAATSQLVVAAPPSATSGLAFTVTVSARDAYGNATPSYAGTVGFSSSDPSPTLPVNYTFAAADAGTHGFSVVLRTGGSQTVTVTDSANPALKGSQAVTVGVNGTKLVLSASAPGSVYGGPLTFTATASSSTGGGPTPTGTIQFVIDGANAGAPVALAGGTAVSTAVANLGAGNHTVSASYSGDASDAPATSAPVAVAVAKAPLTVTADNRAFVYGQALPPLTASYSGFVLGQDKTSLAGTLGFTTAASSSSHVNVYPVTPGGLTSNNYAITFAPGSISVTKATLTVKAADQSSTYGQTPSTPMSMLSGFVNGDTAAAVSGSAVVTQTASASSPVGTYAINAAAGTLAASDYTFSPVNGTLTVTKAHLTVTADNQRFIPNTTFPALTYSLSGFVNGDTAAAVGGAASLSTAANPGSSVGTYAINVAPGTLSATNYDFPNLVGGTLTVGSSSAYDFDGLGHTELAVYRPSTSQWFVLGPTGGRLLATFGAPNLTDVPVPGDYDGLGHTELAVYRPSTSQWFVLGPTGGRLLATFGAPNLADVPVPGDYDGLGHTELAVYRPSTSQWFVLGPTGGRLLATFGAPNLADVPVPGDYDGLGHTELAVYRPSTSQWFVLGPTGGRLLATFGAPNLVDVPVPGDYDGLGHTELAVYRPSTSQWFVLGPTGGRLLATFGAPNLVDVPDEAPIGSLGALGRVGGNVHVMGFASLVSPAAGAPAASGRAPVDSPVQGRRPVPTGPLASALPPSWKTARSPWGQSATTLGHAFLRRSGARPPADGGVQQAARA